MNKKYLVVLLFFVFTTSYGYAQTNLGIRAGHNFFGVIKKVEGNRVKFSESNELMTLWQIGIAGEKAFNDRYAGHLDVMYFQQGWKDISLNYLKISPMFKLNSVPLKKMYVKTGVYFGYALGGSEGSENLTFGKEGSRKAFDFGLGADIGFQFSKVQFGLSGQYGLVNISNAEKVSEHHIGIALNVTFFFLNFPK